MCSLVTGDEATSTVRERAADVDDRGEEEEPKLKRDEAGELHPQSSLLKTGSRFRASLAAGAVTGDM